MWICMVILAAIWVLLLIPVVQQRHAWITWAHGGTALFFTALLLDLAFPQTGDLDDIMWLKISGYVLCLPVAM